MSDDILQLDQQVKLTTRAKIAKLDQNRILGPKGLPYIVKNYTKLNHTLTRKKPKKLSKIDFELQNLSSVLQFYQLWCHTLFPKANFQDCISLIRNLQNRSPGLRIYRRQLIEQEIEKLKIQKGYVDANDQDMGLFQHHPILGDDTDVNHDPILDNTTNHNENQEIDDGEVSDDDFMRPLRMAKGNVLFVDDDDDDDNDLYTDAQPNNKLPSIESQPERPQLQDLTTNSIDTTAQDTTMHDSMVQSTDKDTTMQNIDLHLDIPPPELQDIQDQYAEEEELMREMGL